MNTPVVKSILEGTHSQAILDLHIQGCLTIAVAAVAMFVVGAVMYGPVLFGDEWMALRGMNPGAMSRTMLPPWQSIAEFVRCLLVVQTRFYE